MTSTVEASLSEALQIPGDAEAANGPFEGPADVVVAGAVRAGAEIKAGGSVTVGGAVEAAVIQAAHDVHIEGGIAGRGTGRITAGGSISARFCDEADLHAASDVTITNGGVVHSRIETTGRLLVEQGTVIGGSIYCREGAVLKALGNESQVKTTIAIGVHPDVLAAGNHLEKSQKKQRENVQRIREMVQPLMANIKRLTPQLRERATELMYQADGIESQMNAENGRQAENLALYTPQGDASLLVNERICSGASIIFGDRIAVIQQDRTGPVRFFRRSVKNKVEIVMEELNTGVTLSLVTAEYTPEPPADSAKTPGHQV